MEIISRPCWSSKKYCTALGMARNFTRQNPGSSESPDSETAAELLRDLAQFPLGKGFEIGDGGIFREVLFAIDVRHHGGHGLLREDELQRRLGEGHPFAFVDPSQVPRLFSRAFDP